MLSEGTHTKEEAAIIIRLIRPEDVTGFRAALDAVCRERKYLARLEAPPIEQVQAFINANVKARYPQFVAEVGGEIVGWCDTFPGGASSGTTHVGRLGLGVIPEFRGRGIGRRLIEAILEDSARFDMEKIELTVHATNERAIALYRSFGFVEEGRRKHGWLVDGIYDDIILMALFLK